MELVLFYMSSFVCPCACPSLVPSRSVRGFDPRPKVCLRASDDSDERWDAAYDVDLNSEYSFSDGVWAFLELMNLSKEIRMNKEDKIYTFMYYLTSIGLDKKAKKQILMVDNEDIKWIRDISVTDSQRDEHKRSKSRWSEAEDGDIFPPSGS